MHLPSNFLWFTSLLLSIAHAYHLPISYRNLNFFKRSTSFRGYSSHSERAFHAYRRYIPLRANLDGEQSASLDKISVSPRQLENLVGFRKEDVNVIREMSKFEAQAGNATGAALLDGIANRMDSIMQRSSSRMTAVVMDVPADTSAAGAEEVNMWPFRSPNLRSNGRDLWKVAGADAPHSSARMLDSFDGADGGAVLSATVGGADGGAGCGGGLLAATVLS